MWGRTGGTGVWSPHFIMQNKRTGEEHNTHAFSFHTNSVYTLSCTRTFGRQNKRKRAHVFFLIEACPDNFPSLFSPNKHQQYKASCITLTRNPYSHIIKSRVIFGPRKWAGRSKTDWTEEFTKKNNLERAAREKDGGRVLLDVPTQ